MKLIHAFWRIADVSRQWREHRKLAPSQAMGKQGEDIAHRYLRSKGFEILARRFRLPDGTGEVDIIARDGGIIVFVEVKARRTSEHGAPERAIDREKQRKLIRTAGSYLLKCGADWSQARFDVVTVVLTSPPDVTHYVDAFFPSRTI